jgi:hypothetical protein
MVDHPNLLWTKSICCCCCCIKKCRLGLKVFFLQVSVGTLLAFTIVAVSILILRYVPPDEVPLPSSLQASFRLSQENDEEKVTGSLGDEDHGQGTSEINVVIVVESVKDPLIEKQLYASMFRPLHVN